MNFKLCTYFFPDTWYDYARLHLPTVNFLCKFGEHRGIVHTAVWVIVQPLGQDGGCVLELGVLHISIISYFIKSQKTYGSGGGTEDWNSEDCCVLGKAGDRASF